MTLIQAFQLVIGSIIGIGVLLAGAGYGYAQFFQGRKKLTKDDVELFNEQLEALRKIIEGQKLEIDEAKKLNAGQILILQDDIKRHTQEIGRLQGINEEKEKKIVELTNLLQNRDPALKEFIDLARPVIEQVKLYLDKEVERRGDSDRRNPEVKILA